MTRRAGSEERGPGAGRDPITLFHDDDNDHVHELAVDRRGELIEHIWKVENVELTTVGIDIGSSTSHLMFAKVRLQRKTQALSSQFVVVERRTLWKSPIRLTPFLPDASIDAAALGHFIASCHEEAGLAPAEVDTGAVILTGEAIKRSNARSIAYLFASDAGKFVCASAGHHLEAALAAHGSGTVALSRETARTLLNVDVGGGTTKLALVANGEVLATAAFAVGGRLIAFDGEGRVARCEDSARAAADEVGARIRVGERPEPQALERVIDALAQAAIALIRGDPPTDFARRLLLTNVLPPPGVPSGAGIEWQRAGERVAQPTIAFSGGVSEYIYGREARDFGDIAPALARRLAEAFPAASVVRPAEGIRATVIGASQFTVQVSGKTIHVGDAALLPLRNVPVIAPRLDLGTSISAIGVSEAIRVALVRAPLEEGGATALAIRWRGEPHYERLRALAEGIAGALPHGPLILMIDGDIGRTLGHILEHELGVGRAVVSIDGIELREFDFVDIGAVLRPAEVVPVVIKSLLFAAASREPRSRELAYRPMVTRIQ